MVNSEKQHQINFKVDGKFVNATVTDTEMQQWKKEIHEANIRLAQNLYVKYHVIPKTTLEKFNKLSPAEKTTAVAPKVLPLPIELIVEIFKLESSHMHYAIEKRAEEDYLSKQGK